jgi:ubiquinone/menaquinone biosynthesis C-methylase UbiE
MLDVGYAFRNADGPLQSVLVDCLDFMNGLDSFKIYKRHSWKSLEIKRGMKILDVACGVGFDVVEMAKAYPNSEIVGVDKSSSFIDIARSRAVGLTNAAFVDGDADRLPFPDSAFDGVRIDRSLQHLDDPAAAVREMVRVAKPGGRIVASEPDWGTFFLHDGQDPISAKMAAKWLESIANPYIGRQIGDIFSACGVGDMGCMAHALSLTELEGANVVFDLSRLKTNSVEAGLISTREADDWWASARQASAKRTFLACLTIVERSGMVVKPS